ncbi:MAG: type I restriction endonuclease subunit R [Cyanobacteria bacterium J06581_3]
MITEAQLENLCIQWFQETGWQYIHGPDLAPDGPTPDRTDHRDVTLNHRLTAVLTRINPQLPSDAIEAAVQTVTKPNRLSLLANNQAFHQLILKGVPVTFTKANGSKATDHAQLIDFHNPDNNDFLIVNQFTITGAKKPRRPDIIVFINGLPLAVLELKNPADETADIWKAYSQLQTYKNEISDLFVYNEALVISDGLNARIGSLTAKEERFMPWRTVKSENDKPLLEYQLETLVRGFFEPTLFLDYIRHFVLFEQDGDTLIKKVAGYHQFHGVREAVRVTLIAAAPTPSNRVAEARAAYGKEVIPGSHKAGVFWHTQGSGKSISMCCYAGKLLQQPEMKNPTLVVVTDRNDLDGQLYQQFCKAKALLKQTPEQADSRAELREKLAARASGGIIFTTVQKFSLVESEKKHPVLCDLNNVVVISDEAHRSQYGLKANLNTKTGQYIYGYAKYMRDALPEASFIGFTGTPIALEDKDTRSVFGSYVSIYDVQDAVDDGSTVPIYYESRLAKLDINPANIEALNTTVDTVIEEEETATREETKSKWAALAKLVGAEPRIKQVAKDIVHHFETRTATLDGKAMIVAMSRDICVSLFDEIIALRPDWAGTQLQKSSQSEGQTIGYNPEDGAIRIVMTGNASDREAIQEHIFSKRQKKRLENRFKDPNDPLKLVIVRDMWLTGFDAPCCHTMYVDKPMNGHNLMQAIARVNRVFRGKEGGLVVDYIGIAAALRAALKTYTDAKGRGQPTLKTEEAFAILLEKVNILRGLFHKLDYSKYETNAPALLVPAANHVLGLADGKKRFLDVMAAITKAFSLCGTLDEAAALRKEIAFFSAIKAAIVKHTNVNRKQAQDDKHTALKQILDNAIIAEGVTDVFDLAGLEKPNIGLLSDEFLEDVRNMPARNLAVELLEKLLRDEIRSRSRTNVVQEKKYSDRLLESLRKYHNRAIETAQVIEEMIQMAKDFQKDLARNKDLGLNPDELAFYDALANNESAVREMHNDELKKLATELTRQLRKSTSVDWQVRDSVRAKIRNLVRRLLKRYKYPPDGQKEAITLILQQAEALSNQWTAA